MFPFNFGELPEELKQQIKADHDRSEMEFEATRTALVRLFNELSFEDLSALKALIRSITSHPASGPWYDGVIATMMHVRFGACLFCSESHTSAEHFLDDIVDHEKAEEFVPLRQRYEQMTLDLTGKNQPAENYDLAYDGPTIDVSGVMDEVLSFEFDNENPSPEVIEAITRLNSLLVPPVVPLSGLVKRVSQEWDLEDLWEQNDEAVMPKFVGWQCTECRIGVYPSIQDRMLQPKGVQGCGSCQQKAKWG